MLKLRQLCWCALYLDTYGNLTFSVPEVSIECMLTEVIESNTVVSVGVELKSNLKRDVDMYLDVVELSASGKTY